MNMIQQAQDAVRAASSASQPQLQNPQATSWIEISCEAFAHNARTYHTLLGKQSKLFIVAKANAYGHGLEVIGQLAQQQDEIGGLCVINLSEALVLRSQGFTKQILVLGFIDAPLEQAVIHDIHIAVSRLELLYELNATALQLNKKAVVHIKIDTGMSRLGFMPQEGLSAIDLIINQLSGIYLYGLMSHFAESDATNLTFTYEQVTRFQRVLDVIEHMQLHPLAIHCANSVGTIRIPQAHYALTRVGGGMWGAVKQYHMSAAAQEQFRLRQVLTWKSRIKLIKQLPAGTPVSYACTYVTQRETVLGIIPVGFFEGYPRALSNKGSVLIEREFDIRK